MGCGHGRPVGRMCPHCLGINNVVITCLCGKIHSSLKGVNCGKTPEMSMQEMQATEEEKTIPNQSSEGADQTSHTTNLKEGRE